MQITELVLRNSLAGEIARHEITPDDMGDFNLFALMDRDSYLRLSLEMLSVGDTITVEERWTEAD